jgi:very-short-patch-repair endonuclease
MPRYNTHEEWRNAVEKMHPEKFDLTKDTYKGWDKPFKIACAYCDFEWIVPQTPPILRADFCCKKCHPTVRAAEKINYETNSVIKILRDKHGDRYDFDNIISKKSSDIISITCKDCKVVYTSKVRTFMDQKKICNYCHGNHWNFDKVKKCVEEKFGVDIITFAENTTIKTCNDLIEVGCVKCDKYWKVRVYDIIRPDVTNGCLTCSGSEKKTHEQYLIESQNIHGKERYTYVTKYTGSKDSITIQCNKCKRIFNKRADHHIIGSGCDECYGGQSFGEYLVAKYLKEIEMEYILEHRFPDCKHILPLPFDFYLPEMLACIEFDGKQHYEAIEFFGGAKTLEDTQMRDEIKNKYCQDKKICLLRIKYDQINQIPELIDKFLQEC